MALAIALVLVGAAIVVLWVAIAKEPGSPPEETAVAYELAWDRHDFATVFDLSGTELRDGMGGSQFARSKRDSVGELPPNHHTAEVKVESVDTFAGTAHAVTAVAGDAGVLHNDVVMARRNGRWMVVGYTLRPDTEPAG